MIIVSELNGSERKRIKAAFQRARLQSAGECFRTVLAGHEVIGLYSRTQFGTHFVSLLGRTGPRGKYHDVASPAIDEAARRHFATEDKLC